MTEQEKRLRRCCFAGHRPEGILLAEDAAKAWLREQICKAVSDGYTTFITSMGMGVDIWAAQIVIRLRDDNPFLHLIAAEPYPSFPAKWSDEWAEAYREILRAADYVKQLAPRYTSDASQNQGKWLVNHSARLIAIYNGLEGYTGALVKYARAQGLQTVLYPFPKNTRTENRPYPLNLLDEIMATETYLMSKPVELSDLPEDFNRRLSVVLSILPDDRSADIMLSRFRDGATLQAIGDTMGVTRERIRQIIEKCIRKLRQPDLLRYLNCGIEHIPEKSSKTMVQRLNDHDGSPN